jgi:UDP-N-acetylglucosamine--N-acetylmuramyl-(pentapeptide) pyrophosphoryl-undecaprenol N-acetylglucosamine transferase
LIASLFQSWRLLRRYKPAAVIGVGGFASGPLLEMAYRLKIPTLIHDSNSYPGITNRLLARKADKICVAFSGMERFFAAGRLVLTGNPVRKEIENNLPSREEACAHFKLDASKKVLLVLGGSLGAKTINQSIEQGLEDIEHHGVQLLWQTGKSYHGNARVKNGLRTTFIKDMHHAYAAADVVISRAGAMSVTELCLCGKPAILVPSPNVAEDHQTKNAMALVSNHAAVLVADKEARDELVQEALQLLSDEQRCAQLKMKIEKLAVRGATEKIVDQISELIGDQS